MAETHLAIHSTVTSGTHYTTHGSRTDFYRTFTGLLLSARASAQFRALRRRTEAARTLLSYKFFTRLVPGPVLSSATALRFWDIFGRFFMTDALFWINTASSLYIIYR